MKICPYCQTQNPDSAVLCTECMASIGNVSSGSEECADNIVNEFFEKEEKREKLKAFLWRLPMIVYYVIYIPLFILTVKKDGELFWVMLLPLLFGGLYYLLVFRAELLFELKHMLDIDNIDEVHISEMYFFSSKLSGVIVLIIGLVMTVSACLDVYDVKIGRDNAIVVEMPHEIVKVSYRFEDSGFPSDDELKAFGAVFVSEYTDDSIKSVFDVFYENYSEHLFGNMLFVMDGIVYELIFDGDLLHLFKDEQADGMRQITTTYPEKLIKDENGYALLGDGNTVLLKIDF